MNGLGILIIGALVVLAVLAVKYIVIPLCDRPEGLHRGDPLDLTVPDDTGHIEIAHDGAYDIGSMDYAHDRPEVVARAQRYGDISGPPDGLLWAELTPAAAVEQPPQATPLPPPPVHHDEYAPDQDWHPPTDPAAAASPTPPPPPPDYHAALAVGAAIAATHAQLADQEAARKAELEAEADATRPWEDDTGTFTLQALGLEGVK